MTIGRVAAALAVAALASACTADDEQSASPRATVADPVSAAPAATTIATMATTDTTTTTTTTTTSTITTTDDGIGGADSGPTGGVAHGGEVGPAGSTDVDVTTDAGRVQIGDAELPDTLPAGFPVPDDLAVELATDIGTQAGFSGVTDLAFDEVVELYRDGLTELGFDVRETGFVDGVVAVFEFTGPVGSGDVAIGSAPGGGRSVLVTYER